MWRKRDTRIRSRIKRKRNERMEFWIFLQKLEKKLAFLKGVVLIGKYAAGSQKLYDN